MNILVFTPYYYPHIGGLENHAYEFNEHMAEIGHKITVFTSHIPRHGSLFDNSKPNITIIRFPAFEIIGGYPVPKFWLASFWQQLLMLQNQPYDVILSRTRFFLSSLMALWYARTRSIKYIHIEHGSDFVRLSSSLASVLAKIYDYTLGKLIFFAADAVIANSKASSEFVKKITRGKISPVIIYRGIEEEEIRAITGNSNLRAALAGKTIIIFIGRLITGKGIMDLLKAMAVVNNPAITCLIIGDGPQKQQLLTYLNNSGFLRNNVLLLGEKSRSEVLAILKIADIAINPSYTEGLPTTMIEAALCKKAIIATRVGGTTEIITHNRNGLLYQAGDIKQLAAFIVRLSTTPQERARLGERAYAEVENKFNWQNTIYAYEIVFKNVMLN